MKKVVIWAVVLVVLGAASYVGWRAYSRYKAQNGEQKARAKQAVPVEVALVSTATLKDEGKLTGSLLAESRFNIASRVAGRLKKLMVNIGDTVHRNDLIALIDDREFVSQVDSAQAELAVAQTAVQECRSNMDLAKREYEREAELRQNKIASEAEYDQAKAKYDVQMVRYRAAESQVTKNEAALNEAKIRLSYTRILATWDDDSDAATTMPATAPGEGRAGQPDVRMIAERFVDEGALLSVNSQIVSVIGVQELIAVVNVVERDYAKISLGQPAVLTTDAYPGQTFTGRILRIAPQLQESSRQARVEIRVPNDAGKLRPGMFVRVTLEYAEHKDVPAVPAAALVRRDGRQGVFVVSQDGKTVKFTPVEVGITQGQRVELVGMKPAGMVVVMGQHLLEDGSAVTVVQTSKPAEAEAAAPATSPASTSAGKPANTGRADQ